MKKFFVLLCLVVCLFALSGCEKATDQYGVERNVRQGLLEIEEFSDNGVMSICCDPSTNICYLFLESGYLTGISPYYVIGKDGTPEIAIYGVNYKPMAICKNGGNIYRNE